MNRRLLLNAAVFAMRSDDYQFFYIDLNSGGVQVIDNLEEVSTRGIELELQARVNTNWDVFAALGLLDTEIEKVGLDLTVPAQAGNKAPRTQPIDANVGTQFSFPVGALTATVRLDYEHRGKRYWLTDNQDVMEPVQLLNARMTLGGERWTATLWGRTLTDEFYYSDFIPNEFFGVGRDVASPSAPLTFGVDVRYVIH